LIPVLLLSFSSSYAEAGFFKSIYDIVFLLALPIVSILADRIPARKILLFSLIFYPFVGLSYFAAGAVGLSLFIVLARLINGMTWCCDDIGSNTYLMRYASRFHISETFGYFTALPNFLWIIAALGSLLLIPHVPIHYLFLGIVVTSIVAFVLVYKLPSDVVDPKSALEKEKKRFVVFIETLKGIKEWKPIVWILATITFLTASINVLGAFFLPLYAYGADENITRVVIVSVIFAIPSACALWIGRRVDRVDNKKATVFSFLIMGLILLVAGFVSGYTMQMITIFVLGIILVVIDLAIQSMATKVTEQTHYGRINGIIGGANNIATIIAPIAIGFITDIGGSQSAYFTLGGIAIATAIFLLPIRLARSG
jgi:MFS family permease